MRIMVVEDDALIALDLVGLLTDLGHHVTGEAADPCTAWKLAEDAVPDLALVDIRLARNADGGMLARLLYDRLGVRSLFVSGSISDDFRRDMAAIEPLGFLDKPVSRRSLDAALRAADAAGG